MKNNVEYPKEFNDVKFVVENGARKYSANGWLDPDGHGTSNKDMHASMFRHLADSHSGVLQDKDSGLDPLLHLATRALMVYTRRQRGIIHPVDKKNRVAEDVAAMSICPKWENKAIKVSRKEYDDFVEHALKNPPKPNAHLLELIEWYKRLCPQPGDIKND